MTAEKFYKKKYLGTDETFPSVISLKFFLGNNPNLNFKKSYWVNKKICEIGFGDGRDLNLFSYLKMKVYGVEPNKDIVKHTIDKFLLNGINLNLKKGTNINTGFNKEFFDVVYSSGSIYYLPNINHSIDDALLEVNRILKKDGFFFTTFAAKGTHTIKGAKKIDKNKFILKDSFYKLRKGQCYHVYNNKKEILNDFKKNGFKMIYIGNYKVDWFGTYEKLFIVAAIKN